jgi:hypothetical protein
MAKAEADRRQGRDLPVDVHRDQRREQKTGEKVIRQRASGVHQVSHLRSRLDLMAKV